MIAGPHISGDRCLALQVGDDVTYHDEFLRRFRSRTSPASPGGLRLGSVDELSDLYGEDLSSLAPVSAQYLPVVIDRLAVRGSLIR